MQPPSHLPGIPYPGIPYPGIPYPGIPYQSYTTGRPSWLGTGVDEHGEKVELNARIAGVETREFCDRVAGTFEELTEKVGVGKEAFVRTTSEEHMEGAKMLWRAMEENGDIYKGVYEGWYSVRDEAFYPESELIRDEVTGEMVAPTGAEVEWREKEER
ncbi:hypothetical protein TrRE_jg1428 [Triparma retinervis]|uniref:Methionyl/Leucyl tRNA synthetase domain-containing protein n=1 Tax=Triparma retinervis TaxID=2557542 RepID=A0A9W7DVY1_9STRA|nr:hypothetical protein TrRE_jg1428 [Triparma retinervis]